MSAIYRPLVRCASLLLLLGACRRTDAPASHAADSLAPAASTSAAGATAGDSTRAAIASTEGHIAPCASGAADSLCFHASRTYDFARDGHAFTLTVDARGPRADAMRVALRIARGDTVFHRADWSTALYAKYDATPATPDSARRRAESQLARLLADSAFRPTHAFLGGARDVARTLREAIAFDVAVAGERARRGLTPADTLPLAARESPTPTTDTSRVRALATELRDAPAFRYHAGGEASYVIAWSAAERRFVVVFACC